MGKLTQKQTQEAIEQCGLTPEQITRMQQHGLIAQTRHKKKRFILTADGYEVTPVFAFAGAKNCTPSAEMIELREKVQQCILNYTTTH